MGFLVFELLVNNASSDTLAFSLHLVPFLPAADSPATHAGSSASPYTEIYQEPVSSVQLHGMRCADLCGLVAFARCALVAVASAGGAMLLTEGF